MKSRIAFTTSSSFKTRPGIRREAAPTKRKEQISTRRSTEKGSNLASRKNTMPGMTRTTPRPKRPLAAPLLSFSLAEEVDRLRKEPEWEERTRNSITLVKTPDLSVVLVALRNGGSICGHEVEGPITLLVLSGAIRFRAGESSKTLKTTEMASVGKAVPHDVKALEDSAFLLTIANPYPSTRNWD